MLAACLVSLEMMVIPDDVDPLIIVLSNGDAADEIEARRVVSNFQPATSIKVEFRHIEGRGIARARNAVLEFALHHNVEWIAFLDDDERADSYWLHNLMEKGYRDTPVLMGQQIWQYPDPMPFWCVPAKKGRKTEGERLKTAFTHNVRFSMDLVRAGLRFNEQLGDMGGEDNEFFAEACKQGFAIQRTLRAITIETAHKERLTYLGQCYRSYWTATSDVRRLALQTGWARAMAVKAHTVPFNLIAGALELGTSPAFLAAGTLAFKKRALAGGKKIAKGFGRAAAMLGIMPSPYRKIAGG